MKFAGSSIQIQMDLQKSSISLCSTMNQQLMNMALLVVHIFSSQSSTTNQLMSTQSSKKSRPYLIPLPLPLYSISIMAYLVSDIQLI